MFTLVYLPGLWIVIDFFLQTIVSPYLGLFIAAGNFFPFTIIVTESNDMVQLSLRSRGSHISKLLIKSNVIFNNLCRFLTIPIFFQTWKVTWTIDLTLYSVSFASLSFFPYHRLCLWEVKLNPNFYSSRRPQKLWIQHQYLSFLTV